MPISINLNGERKQNMKSLLTTIGLALALATPAFAGVEWTFDNTPNNNLNTTVSATFGVGTATISAGTYGSGWHNGTVPYNYGLSGATQGPGLWELGSTANSGTPGSIVLSGVTASGLTTLSVFQWVDPTYTGDLSVKVDNGPLLSAVATIVGTPNNYGGAWWDYTYNLGVPLTSLSTVTITAGSGGAIIDRLTLVPEPATLIAGAVLLIPFALSTWPIIRRRRTS